TVKGHVKSPLSVINKLRRKRLVRPFVVAKAGEVYTQGLTDMAGCMAVVEDLDALLVLLEQVQEGAVGTVREHEDFYRRPNAGYRAHHFIVERDGLPVEVQLKTKRLARLSGASHEAYKRGLLDASAMNALSLLAVNADAGDAEAAAEFDG